MSSPTVIVMKIGGALLEPESLAGTAGAIAAFIDAHSEHCATCIVHGGGAIVTRILRDNGFESHFKDGVRVTAPGHMGLVANALHATTNRDLCAELNAHGVRAEGFRATDMGTVQLQPFDPGRGFGRVADARPGDREHVDALFKAGVVPVFSSIGHLNGEAWNVNADTAAGAIAGAIHASLLLMVSNVPGVLGDDGHVIPTLNQNGAAVMIDSGLITGGMVAKVTAAFRARSIAGCDAVVVGLPGLAHIDPGRSGDDTKNQSTGTRLTNSNISASIK